MDSPESVPNADTLKVSVPEAVVLALPVLSELPKSPALAMALREKGGSTEPVPFPDTVTPPVKGLVPLIRGLKVMAEEALLVPLSLRAPVLDPHCVGDGVGVPRALQPSHTLALALPEGDPLGGPLLGVGEGKADKRGVVVVMAVVDAHPLPEVEPD